MESPSMETAYNCRQFPYLSFKMQNAKKHAFCNGGQEIRKLSTSIGSFRILILSGKTSKNMRFAMKNRYTETAYNCRHFPYLNFK